MSIMRNAVKHAHWPIFNINKISENSIAMFSGYARSKKVYIDMQTFRQTLEQSAIFKYRIFFQPAKVMSK